MGTCRKCSWPLPEGSKYCPTCGAKVDVSRNTKSRGNGQGSVYKRGKTWQVTKTIGLYTEGQKVKRLTKSKGGFKTKKEALLYLATMSNEPTIKPKTMQQVYEAWLPTHTASRSTMLCYQAAFGYFRPIWHQTIESVTIDDLQDCVDDCPKGKRTRQNMKAVCGLLYKYAIPRQLARLNMAQYIRVGAEDSIERKALPREALEALEAHVETVPYADYILCQCYMGFRPSELLALDAANYDRRERAFTGGAKTEAGKNRVVTVAPKIQPIIDRLTADKIGGPVFCGPDGEALSIARYRDAFYRTLELCGIDNPWEGTGDARRRTYTPHSCRRTFATLIKDVDAADKDKLELIGHTSTEMLRHYQRTDLQHLRGITDRIK